MEWLSGYAVFDWIATWANPACDVIFRAATDLGHHTFYYITIVPLFWVVDRRRAGILLLLVLASGLVNTTAKLWVNTPRPDPHLARVLDLRPYQSGSNAFPSGHAQNAVVFWGCLAWWVRRSWFSALAVCLILLISFSRLYLGVHFPIDIVGGLALGSALMATIAPLLERWSRSGFRVGQMGAATLVGVSLVLAVASGDSTLAMVWGSLVGFLAGAVWLPQPDLLVRDARHTWAAVVCGLVVLFVASLVAESLPQTPLVLYLRVATLWVLAVWCYPWALQRALPILTGNRQ